MSTRVIIDTDPGIDDAQAILYTLLSGQFDVEAVTTTFGNCSVANSTDNALRVLELVGREDIPVYRGAAEPLVCRRLDPSGAARVHGPAGLGGKPWPAPRTAPHAGYAAAELARRVVDSPGELTILALAPLTNLALAIRLEPTFVDCVKQIIYMGGIVRGPGNVTQVATANVLNDPEAARIVFRSGTPAKLTMVGQDVTRTTRIEDELHQRLRRLGGPVAEFVYDISDFYRNAYATVIEPGRKGFPVHDLLVMVYALHPELFETQHLHVDIETTGALTSGMTVADFRPSPPGKPNVNVCLGVQSDAVLAEYERVMKTAALS